MNGVIDRQMATRPAGVRGRLVAENRRRLGGTSSGAHRRLQVGDRPNGVRAAVERRSSSSHKSKNGGRSMRLAERSNAVHGAAATEGLITRGNSA